MGLGVGIVGCGLIGRKRAAALAGHRLVACTDLLPERAGALAAATGATAVGGWRELLTLPGLDVVIVATTNDSLADISLGALEAGRHVLVEKPAARTVGELDTVAAAARRHGPLVRVGFNHRFHPALRKAHELFRQDAIGELMFVRGRYGHGGRPGYDREWRADPRRSGGGELIDQGVHLIDLAGWFLGDFESVVGSAHTYYWQMPVDDNVFLMLRTRPGQMAFLHASCTEWKNLFSLEVYGRRGKLHVEGLGGSYGTERVACYRMLPELGPPDTTIWEFPRGDDSWRAEFAEFAEDIRLNRQPEPGLTEARKALSIVEQVYQASGYPGGAKVQA